MADEDQLPARVAALARQLGRSVSDVLRRAGLSRSFLDHAPKHGRRTDRVEALARELGVTLADLVLEGAAAAHCAGTAAPKADQAVLQQAVRVAMRLAQVEMHPERVAVICRAAAALYDYLVQRRAAGHPDESDEALELMARALLRED